MLFNSFAYIFGFMPVVAVVFFALGRRHPRLAGLWLAVASLGFYGWWNPAYVGLLLGSIAWNFAAALLILRQPAGARSRGWLLGLAIAGDLALLGWFKYADFLLQTASALAGSDLGVLGVVLPLGISFFTFTQIAFLVDTARGEVREVDPVNYVLFVTFFPHLLAGPVLHHAEMMPQFARPETYRPRAENFSVGLTLFIIGLFKKTVLADCVAPHATQLFDAAATGGTPGMALAWTGALAYAFQLYFDFSGYSDMAIGAARVFGIVLPENFRSPYKAASLIEFWRCWHMTLSRFLRDYLYVPLGGNRRGAARRYLNLLATMLLGGLWHGSAWTFVAWGALHGVGLALNHLWAGLRRRLGLGPPGAAGRAVAVLATFGFVTIAWVPFRADGFGAAARILHGMVGLNGAGETPNPEALLWLVVLGAICFLAPNGQQFLRGFHPVLVHGHDVEASAVPRWQPRTGWAMVFVGALLAALSRMSDVSPFLYYRF